LSVFTKAVVGFTHAAPVRSVITKTTAGRRLAHRFVAGDTLTQAVTVARQLNDAGLLVSLDHLGEEVTDRPTALAARRDYLDCIDSIAAEGLDANISIKLTQLGLAFDPPLAAEAVSELAGKAREAGTTVTIDMEDSRFTAATVDLYATAQKEHGNLGLALQTYLYRTVEDLRRLAPLGGHLRLCKGAYVEPPDIAYQTRHEVSAAFAALLEELMAADKVRPAIATHDLALIDLAKSLGAGRTNFEFQMLYGVRTAVQKELAAQGFPMRVYVPFGSHWYPYLTRRLGERPANLGLFLRAFVGR